jgi:hypothetical protein
VQLPVTALVLSLRLAAALSVAQAATPAPDPDAPPWTPPVFPTPEPPSDTAPREPWENTWLDVTHEFIETRLFTPILQFDRFFSDEAYLEEERARSFLRWRSEFRMDSERPPAFTTGVSANLRLPGLNLFLRRARLVVEGQTRQAIGVLFPEEPGATAGQQALGRANAEVRYGIWDGLLTHVDLGAGVLFSLPPGVFARAGLRWRREFDDLFLARASVVGYWRSDVQLGSRANLQLERPVWNHAVLRLGNEVAYGQRTLGLEWTPDLQLVVALGPLTAASGRVAMEWASAPRPQLGRWVMGLRLRRDFFRRWLFLELEPEFYWPWTPELGRHAAWGVTTRVEVQFHGNAPERPAEVPGDEPGPGAPAPDRAGR